MNESHTIARARTGDRDAIALLWDAHTPVLYGYLVRTLRNPTLAEDMLQATWIAALEALPTFGRRGSMFRAWLFAIARNECRQHWRRQGRETPLDLEAHDLPAPPHDYDAVITVDHALARLSPEDRDLLALRYIADLSTSDIARILNVSGVAIRVRLHRALRRARATLDHLV